jgi:predicted nucleotidyltransferase
MTIHNTSEEDTGSGAPIAVSPDEWHIVRTLLRKLLPDCEVWAFGSRAGGQPKPFSDLDLALIAERPIGLGVLAALAEVFSESDLPWRVDLVDWGDQRTLPGHHPHAQGGDSTARWADAGSPTEATRDTLSFVPQPELDRSLNRLRND